MNKKKNDKGFSMAEVLIAVAILVVLAALAFIGVSSYMKSMHQLEMDAIAKEIFIAAQNHLSMADGQGFPGVTDFGHEDGEKDGIYYFVYGDENPYTSTNSSLIDLMLPFGAVDETVRAGGSYVIQYQKSPAIVLGVFYATRTGRYSLSDGYSATDINPLFNPTGEKNYMTDKEARKNYREAVIGYCGGEGLQTGKQLLPLTDFAVINEENLRVEVTNPNSGVNVVNGVDSVELQLIITGLSSNAKKAYDLNTNCESRCIPGSATTATKIILDDLTNKQNLQFGRIVADTASTTGEKFFIGENISIQIKAFSTDALTNVVSTEVRVTNSLFDTGTAVKLEGNNYVADALIANFRHLENLSKNISGCGDANVLGVIRTPIQVQSAVQTKDMVWSDFLDRAEALGGTTMGTRIIHPLVWTKTDPDMFRAIVPAFKMTYDGGYHFIKGATVNELGKTTGELGDAGLFSELLDGSAVKNLELINCAVTGTENAGTLVGHAVNTNVQNVLVRHETESAVGTVSGAVDAGGLIGKLEDGGNIEYSAASVIVNGTANAGGLIGSVTTGTGTGNSTSTIEGCYSGGHTDGTAAYDHVKYNVTSGGAAGGLVGSFSGTSIENSYSTCSVNSTATSGGVAGGFVGNNTSGSITNSYCTGLVSGGLRYAFVGDGTAPVSGCHYYEIINEDLLSATEKYMLPYKEYNVDTMQPKIVAIDHETSTYNKFVGSPTDSVTVDGVTLAPWTKAEPYDSTLGDYYQGKYNLRSVARLGADVPVNYYVNTHYGDWPAPEIFVVNIAS